MSFDLESWFSKKNEGSVIISYKGEITTDLITDVLEIIEVKLNKENANPRAVKKLYNVLVECLQNLYHHAEILPSNGQTPEKEKKISIFVVSKSIETFKITTGNIIKNEKIDFLLKRINHINSLDEEALKALYKEILNNQDFSEKGGGGLGMIDIARKSGSKLECNFFNYYKDYSFFDFSIKIS